ncbi:MAG: hypothetical protein U9R25_17080, partial [Chloroflexota bacterium]|nr:hypothetical protein [Chloroflexota bacterium]
MKLRRLSTILLSGLVLLSSVVSAAAGDQPLATLAENSSLDRTREPVVVTGVFPGKPVEEIFVYGWNAGSWEQIPFQVDERDASGELVDVEDGVMDENDDVVFMAGDLGDQPGVPIGFELPVGDLWFQVEVSDPLDPGSKGWATVVHSRVLSVTNPTDYIDFDPVNKRIISSDYGLGWATAASVPPGQGQHNGLD